LGQGVDSNPVGDHKWIGNNEESIGAALDGRYGLRNILSLSDFNQRRF
jgi:hypothetical protein